MGVKDFLHEHPRVRQAVRNLLARLGLSVGLETTGVQSWPSHRKLGAVGQKRRTGRIEEFWHETISTYAKCGHFGEDERPSTEAKDAISESRQGFQNKALKLLDSDRKFKTNRSKGIRAIKVLISGIVIAWIVIQAVSHKIESDYTFSISRKARELHPRKFCNRCLDKGRLRNFSLKSAQEQAGIQLAELPLQAKMHNLYKNKWANNLVTLKGRSFLFHVQLSSGIQRKIFQFS